MERRGQAKVSTLHGEIHGFRALPASRYAVYQLCDVAGERPLYVHVFIHFTPQVFNPPSRTCLFMSLVSVHVCLFHAAASHRRCLKRAWL